MATWRPITADALEQIVERQLAVCEVAQQQAFRQLSTALRAVPIVRSGNVESVFVVAQCGNEVLYYEDVEEGFNLSQLDSNGGIASPGFEQWELCHALHHWLGA